MDVGLILFMWWVVDIMLLSLCIVVVIVDIIELLCECLVGKMFSMVYVFEDFFVG